MTEVLEFETHSDPLPAVRAVLDAADEARLGVAFVPQRGVHLLERQPAPVPTGRLVTTTVFGSTTAQGLQAALSLRLGVRVLNPRRGTFHPELYVARHGDQIAAAVGSANLTSGRVANRRARGGRPRPCPSAAAARAVRPRRLVVGARRRRRLVARARGRAPAEVLEPSLLAAIQLVVAVDPEVVTLGARRVIRIRAATSDGVWVGTRRTRAAGRPAQLVPARSQS